VPRSVMFLLAGLTLATVLLAGCGGQDTPVEQAEEEAGVEEVVEEETTERDIHTEGCPEGQVSNAAGTECMDPSETPSHEPSQAYVEEAQRKEAQRIVEGYEGGMSNIAPVECQLAKLQLDVGETEAQRVVEGWDPMGDTPTVRELQAQGMDPQEAMRQVREAQADQPTLPEYLAERGYAC
jgi:hypothetical protein